MFSKKNTISETIPFESLCFLLLIFCNPCIFAQTTRYSSVSSTIINPVSISKNVNSEFGNVAVIISGIIEMSPVKKTNHLDDIVLPVSTGTFTAATYYYSGNSGYSFTVSSPASPLIIRNGASSMNVISFDSFPVQSESSGAIAGVYISVSPSRVTVNYN